MTTLRHFYPQNPQPVERVIEKNSTFSVAAAAAKEAQRPQEDARLAKFVQEIEDDFDDYECHPDDSDETQVYGFALDRVAAFNKALDLLHEKRIEDVRELSYGQGGNLNYFLCETYRKMGKIRNLQVEPCVRKDKDNNIVIFTVISLGTDRMKRLGWQIPENDVAKLRKILELPEEEEARWYDMA